MYFEKTANMQCGFIKNKCVLLACHCPLEFFIFCFNLQKQLKIQTAKVRATCIHMLKKKSTLKKPADLTNKLSMLLHKTNEHFGDHDTEFEEATLCSTKIFEGSPVLL